MSNAAQLTQINLAKKALQDADVQVLNGNASAAIYYATIANAHATLAIAYSDLNV